MNNNDIAVARVVIDGQTWYAPVHLLFAELLFPTVYSSPDSCVEGVRQDYEARVERAKNGSRDQMNWDMQRIDEARHHLFTWGHGWEARIPVVNLTLSEFKRFAVNGGFEGKEIEFYEDETTDERGFEGPEGGMR